MGLDIFNLKQLHLKHPLVAVLAAYVGGLLLGRWFQPPWMILLGGCLLLLFSLLLLAPYRKVLIWLLLILAGWTNQVAQTAVRSGADLRVLIGDEPALVTVRGEVAATPQLRIIERDEQERWRTLARVRVTELARADGFQPASGEIMVATPEVLVPDFFRSQRVEISGVLARPPLPLAEGLFNFRDYLATRGIYYQLKTQSTNDWKPGEPRVARPPWDARFLDWAHGVLGLGLPGEDQTLRLLWAMTLGWRTAFTGDIGDPFLRAGTMHLFAIDGLRIGLVAGMAVLLLRIIRISRGWCGVVVVPVIWGYTAATGWESPAVRASVMMTIVLGGWALTRPVDLLNSLAAAALVILAVAPAQLGEAGFLLSFCVMLVIAVTLKPMTERVDGWINRWLAPDPLLPADLVPAWRRKVLEWVRQVAHLGALSLAAWLGSLPLAAEYFHLFSPVSTLANVPAVPLGALALAANMGALVCGHWLPWLTALFNHAAWSFMWALTWLSTEAARLPGAYWYVPEPSGTTIVIYYAVLVAAFSGWFNTARRRWMGAAILVVILGVYGARWEMARGQTKITVLPLSGGHAVWVDAAGRQNDWLINCGNADAVDFTLKNYLRGQGVNTVGRLVLADGSARDCGGAGRLNELFGVRELWMSGVPFRSPVYRQAMAAFSGRSRHEWAYGMTNGCWRRLFPRTTAAPERAEDAALVLRGDFGGTRVLLLSELSRAGQSELLAGAGTNDLRAEMVIAGLPDASEPLCDALLAVVQPKLIIIADAEYPASRRAGRALKERLARCGVPVIYTREAGAVVETLNTTGALIVTQQ